MKNKSIKVDGVSISKDFIHSFKSEADFLKAMEENTYAHLFEGSNREAKLKSVFSSAQPKEEPKVTAPKGAAGKP